MRFIELFAGIGGFRYGLHRVGCSRPQYGGGEKGLPSKGSMPTTKESPFTCVWANEIDKYAAQVYRKNYGGGNEDKDSGQSRGGSRGSQCLRPIGDSTHSKGNARESNKNSPKKGWDERSKLYEGDIRTVSPGDIPEAEMLVGGFPCQAFSIAGKRKGFEDTRGTLFYEIARLARANRYKILFLENVRGLLSHENGATFETIIRVLDDLGYDVEWQVLNSKNFGVPQNRERVFIIGHLRGECGGTVFPIGEGYGRGLTQLSHTGEKSDQGGESTTQRDRRDV